MRMQGQTAPAEGSGSVMAALVPGLSLCAARSPPTLLACAAGGSRVSRAGRGGSMAPPASAPPAGGSGAELAIEGKTVKAVTLLSLKRTHDLFVGNHGQKVPLDEAAQKAKLACKVSTPSGGGGATLEAATARESRPGTSPPNRSLYTSPVHCCCLLLPPLAGFHLQMRDEYSALQGFKPREAPAAAGGRAGGKPAAAAAAAAAADSKSQTSKLIDSIPAQRCVALADGRAERCLHARAAGLGWSVVQGGVVTCCHLLRGCSPLFPLSHSGPPRHARLPAGKRRLAASRGGSWCCTAAQRAQVRSVRRPRRR